MINLTLRNEGEFTKVTFATTAESGASFQPHLKQFSCSGTKESTYAFILLLLTAILAQEFGKSRSQIDLNLFINRWTVNGFRFKPSNDYRLSLAGLFIWPLIQCIAQSKR